MRSRTSLILTLLKQRADPGQIMVKLALRRTLLGCESVLDVGCGSSPLMRQLGVKHSAGIEGYAPSFEEAKKRNTHDQLTLGDVRNLTRYFRPRQFDACVALDVIEHLTKPDGLKLMEEMEKIARCRVVIFTPNGFLPQRHSVNDDLQEHLSGWEAAEMEQLGYQVTGLLGPKTLRGEGYALKRRPAVFWGLISMVGDVAWTRHRPAKAAAILCVKSIAGT